MKKRVTSLEDERSIHGMLTAQLERNKTLLDRENVIRRLPNSVRRM